MWQMSVQHLGAWKKKFYRKMCDNFQFSIVEGLGKIWGFYMHSWQRRQVQILYDKYTMDSLCFLVLLE